MRRRVVTVLKLALGIGLLAVLLLWQDNARKLVDLLAGFQAEYLLVLFVIALLLRWVSALKWAILLRERDIRVPLLRLFNLYLIGQFFNNFMPSMIGGDVTKIYLLGRQIRSQARSAASVVVDRFTGLVALIFLVLVFALVNHRLVLEPVIGATVALILAGCLVLLALLSQGRRLSSVTGRLARFPGLGPVVRQVDLVYQELVFYGKGLRTLSFAFICALMFYVLTGLSLYFSCVAVGFRPSFLDVALVTPIIFLVTSIPVSPNNIGWWEWSVSLMLGGTGASSAEGLLVALTMRAVSTVLSLFGGILFLFERVEVPQEPRRSS